MKDLQSILIASSTYDAFRLNELSALSITVAHTTIATKILTKPMMLQGVLPLQFF
jgi:hypothetical protein